MAAPAVPVDRDRCNAHRVFTSMRRRTLARGCGDGFTCVPKVDDKTALCMQPLATSCPSNTSLQSWYLGYSDSRSCQACSCHNTGGNCDGVSVSLGTDWGCTTIKDTLK